MSLNYTAHFKYEYSEAAQLPGEDPRGHAICQIDIEREPVTPEEWREVSATIFRKAEGAYKSVEIVKLFVSANQTPGTIEGEVVDG